MHVKQWQVGIDGGALLMAIPTDGTLMAVKLNVLPCGLLVAQLLFLQQLRGECEMFDR